MIKLLTILKEIEIKPEIKLPKVGTIGWVKGVNWKEFKVVQVDNAVPDWGRSIKVEFTGPNDIAWWSKDMWVRWKKDHLVTYNNPWK